MGRKTFASLNAPLPRRSNIVVSRSTKDLGDEVVVRSSLAQAIEHAERIRETPQTPIWIAGGGEIYKAALGIADQIVRTLVHAEVEGDVFFPEIDPSEWTIKRTEQHEADDAHTYGFTIEWWERRERERSEDDADRS